MATKRFASRFLVLCAALALAGHAAWGYDTLPVGPADSSISRLMSPQSIIQFLRVHYQIPSSVTLTATPVHRTLVPLFYETMVTSNDGKQTRTSGVFVTRDARCIALGNVFALKTGSIEEIDRCIRQAAHLPESAHLTLSRFEPSGLPRFVMATATVELIGKTRTAPVYVTIDRRAGVLGTLLPYRPKFVEQLINTKDQPGAGATSAPVTIVEYADLECPYCALYQKFLENEFLPKYRSRVRLVFKEFPLPGHDWSRPAAIANECGFEINPLDFINYRSSIFASQDSINATNVRGRLLDLGQEAGIDRLKLASCLDSRGSEARIQTGVREGTLLGINSTPTFFVNGRPVTRATPVQFERIVDLALADASIKPASE